jgi:hypothetical protein
MVLIAPPSRADVDEHWRAVARGEIAREAVSAWAEPLMFAEYGTEPDLLVMQALQYLHGLDMTYRSEDGRLLGHGPPGAYVRNQDDIWSELHEWRRRCRDYDADPVGWIAARHRDAVAEIQRERNGT